MSSENVKYAAKVTNNLSDPVIAIQGNNNNPEDHLPMYMQDTLTVLQDSAGTTGIGSGTSATFEIGSLANIIFASRKTLFPVKIEGYNLGLGAKSYPDVTIEEDDKNLLTVAEQFVKTVMTNPSSKFAEGYAQASTRTNDNPDTQASINKWLKTQEQFKTLTNNEITAVQTYYQLCPDPWALNKDTYTYYLYSSDGSTTTDQGTLTISRKNPTSDTAISADERFECQYTAPDDGETKPIYYIDGAFVSSRENAVLDIDLSGIFMWKSSLTHKSSDKQIIPVMSGSVNGTKVLGTNPKYTPPKPESPSEWSFFEPTSLPKIIMLVAFALGLFMALEWAGLKAKSAYDYLKGKKNGNEPTPQDYEESSLQIDQLNKTIDDLAKKMSRDLVEPNPDNINRLRADTVTQIANDQIQMSESQLELINDRLSVLAKFQIDTQMEGIKDHITYLFESLRQVSEGDDLQTKMGAIQNIEQELLEINSIVQKEFEAVQSNLPSGEPEHYRALEEMAEQVAEQRTNAEERAHDVSEGESEPVIEDTPVDGK